MIDDDLQFETAAASSAAAPQPLAPPVAPMEVRRDGSFPLIALLQLAAFSAALVACIDGRRLMEILSQSPPLILAAAAGVSVVVGFLAVVFGFGHLRRWRTALAAGAMGALHGPAILAAFAAPAPFWRAGPAVAVLLISTIVLRIRSA